MTLNAAFRKVTQIACFLPMRIVAVGACHLRLPKALAALKPQELIACMDSVVNDVIILKVVIRKSVTRSKSERLSLDGCEPRVALPA